MSGLLNIPTRTRGMSLQTKMMMLTGLVLVALIMLPYALAQLILLHSFAHLEDEEIHRDTGRFVNALNTQLEVLNNQVYDWASSDDTYQYLQDRDPLFVERKMSDTTLRTLRISLVLMLDSSGQLVYGKVFSTTTGESSVLSPELVNQFLSQEILAPYANFTTGKTVSGFVLTPFGPLLVATQPILDSLGQGSSRGTFVLGRYLSEDELHRMAATTILAVDFRSLDDPRLPDDFRKALGQLQQQPGIVNFTLDGNRLAGYALVNDISGQPALILRITTPREIYHQGQDTVLYFELIFVTAGLVLIAAVVWMINRQVIARLLRLSLAVRQVGQTGDLSQRVPAAGRDELAAMGHSINALLEATHQSQAALRQTHEELEQRVREQARAEAELHESQERLELALQAAELGLWDWFIPTGEAVFNQRWAEIVGYSLDEVGTTLRLWRELLHPEDRGRVEAVLDGHLEGRIPFYDCEYRLRSKTGDYKWILARGKVVQRDEHGQPLRMIGTHLDISARRQGETERNRLLQQMRARTIELAAVAEISRQITTILDIEPLLWTICQLIKDEFDLYHVHIYLLDEPGENLKLVAGQGEIGRQLVARQHSIALQNPRSLVARAARARESVVISDVNQSADFLPNPLLPLTQSELALPMLVGSTLIGVLDVQADSIDRFTPEDVNIQTTLAAQVAIAIHNARLFTDSARRLAIIEEFNDLVALADLQAPVLSLLYINPSGAGLLGYERAEEMIGRPVREFYPPEDRERLREEILPTALQQGLWRGENRLRRRDGSVVPVEQVVFVIRDERGEPHDLATIITDITERKRSEEALAKMQALLYSSITQIPAGLVIAEGPDIQVRIANAMAAEILGQPIHHVPDFKIDNPEIRAWTSLHPDRTPYAMADLPLVRAIRNGESTQNAEMIVRQSTGEERWTLTNSAPVRNASGEVIAGVTVFLDITERKRSEEAVRRANRAYRALSESNQAMVRAADEASLLTDICQTIVVAGGYRMAWVAYFDGGPELRPVAHAGYEAGYLTEIIPNILHNTGPTLTALQTGTPYVVRDIATDTIFLPWRDAALQRGYRSVIALPLQIEGQSFGILNVYAAEPHVFDMAEINLLTELANDLAYGITALRLRFEREQTEEQLRSLYTRLEKRSRELLMLYEIGHALTGMLDVRAIYRVMYEGIGQRLLDAPNFLIGLYDEAHRSLTCDFVVVDGQEIDPAALVVMPLDSGPNSETIRTRLPHVIQIPDSVDMGNPVPIAAGNPAQPRAALFVPLISGDQVIGVLNMQHNQADAFAGTDLTLVSTFANQAATAIQNARLFAAEHEQRQLSEALRSTATTITRTLDSTVVIDRILDNLQAVIPHSAANLMLLEAGRVHVVGYRGYAERGIEEWVRRIDIPIDKMTLLIRMMHSGQPAVIADIDRDYPGWALSPEAQWVKSYAGAPIQREGRVIGFLNLYGDVPEFFGPADADRLQAFADQAAIAIRNAQLFTDERDQRTLAEALRDTAAAINQTLDFDDVLDLILEFTGRVVPHDAANIMLIEDGVARVVRGHGYAEHEVEAWVNDLRYVVDEIPVWRRMMETGLPFAIPDTTQEPDWLGIPEEAWIRSTVKAPIRVEGRIIGILHLDSTTPGAFTQQHADRLQAFADQAAIALRNAQFFAAERDQRALAEALRDTAAAINSTLNFDAVAEAILNNVSRVAAYDQADLMLVENGVGRVVRSYPLPTDPERLRWSQEARFVVADIPNMATMVQTGQPLVIPDRFNYAGWVDHPETHWIRSNASAPIQREGRVLGFLILNAGTPGFFTQEHASRLQAFADQAAVAIHNAQLFAEVEQRVRVRTLELEQRRAQIQAILDSIGEGVIYDEKLRVRYINRALTQLTGYGPEEYITYLEPLRSSQHTEEEFQALIRRIYEAVDRLGIWRGELRLRRKSGSEFDAALFVTPVRDALDRVLGAVTVIRDISQEKALREQKDRFIASASHELRTPLANFKTRLYLLKNQPEKSEQHIAILNRVTNSMNELVENLLDVSRFERGVIPMHRRPAALQDIINDVVVVQIAEAERRDLILTTALYPRPLRAFVDPHRLSQVVTNLISNAINYTQPGGQITVELALDKERVPRRALMRVRDTGIGISPEMLAQVFDPFFRGSEEVGTGAGLGLTIAREIVKLHDGQIMIESEVGRGSVFTVTLELLEP